MRKLQVVKIVRFKNLVWIAPFLVVALMAGLVQACCNLIATHQQVKTSVNQSASKPDSDSDSNSKAKVTVNGHPVTNKEKGQPKDADTKADQADVKVSDDHKSTDQPSEKTETAKPDGSLNVSVTSNSTNSSGQTRVNVHSHDRDSTTKSNSNVRLKLDGEGSLNYQK